MPIEEPGSTALVVLTPEAEPVVGSFYREHLTAGRDGMTPHVTLVAPFVSRPFIDLVLALTAEFPDYPPYEGVHDELIQHVTVAESQDHELLKGIRSETGPRLPIECRAEAITLVE